MSGAGAEGTRPDSAEWRAPFEAPAVSLPTGGGAIRGIGEKFAANPVTGSATFSIPLPVSPGRGGFGPQLTLTYDSASGNGPFGFGWSLALPAITRRTDKGLPRYRDSTDTFLVAGAEDLVPVLDAAGEIADDKTSDPDYVIRRYRPRIEGLFARIERWTSNADGEVHWRSISADNVLTVYGKNALSRIADPADPSRIFSWLICEMRDDKGNAVVYDYKAEDGIVDLDLDLAQAHERNRGARDRTANRYVDRIRYGNAKTLLDHATLRRPLLLSQEMIDATRWLFEVVFDYGDPTPGDPEAVGLWTARPDPFSGYRAGFEVRTYRLCRRVLLTPRASRRRTLPRPLARPHLPHDAEGGRQQRPRLQLPRGCHAVEPPTRRRRRSVAPSPAPARRVLVHRGDDRRSGSRGRRADAREPPRRSRRRLPVGRSRRRRALGRPRRAGGRVVLQAQPGQRRRFGLTRPIAAAARAGCARTPDGSNCSTCRATAPSISSTSTRRWPGSTSATTDEAGSSSCRSRACRSSTGTIRTCASSTSPATGTRTC